MRDWESILVNKLLFCLLHLQLKLNKFDLILVNNNLFLAAKMLIAKFWLQETIPTILEWRIKGQYLLLMSKLTAIKKGREGNELAVSMFTKVWTKFMAYGSQVKPEDNITQQVLQTL